MRTEFFKAARTSTTSTTAASTTATAAVASTAEAATVSSLSIFFHTWKNRFKPLFWIQVSFLLGASSVAIRCSSVVAVAAFMLLVLGCCLDVLLC